MLISVLYLLLPFTDGVVVVAVPNFIQIGDQLVERVAIDDQTGDPFGRVANDVGRSQIIPAVSKKKNNV